MANQNSAKGNPASHRMSNANLKARRARSWKAGQERKESRRKQAEARTKYYKKMKSADPGFRTVEELGQIIRKARVEGRMTQSELSLIEGQRRMVRKNVRLVMDKAA